MSKIHTSERRVTTVHQAYRFSLDPTASQRRALASHCGAARFAFNWGLEQVQAAMALRKLELCMYGEVRSELVGWSLPALRLVWNRNKATVAPWWAANSKEAYSSGLAALAAALKNWSDSRRGARAGELVGFPRFRRRGQRDSCAFTTGALRVDDGRHVTLPRIGRLRTAEATTKLLRRVTAGSARILRATVSREADRWFVSFTCVVVRPISADNRREDIVGVDLGVHTLAALSTANWFRGRGPCAGGSAGCGACSGRCRAAAREAPDADVPWPAWLVPIAASPTCGDTTSMCSPRDWPRITAAS